jgi:hypothetical protein
MLMLRPIAASVNGSVSGSLSPEARAERDAHFGAATTRWSPV